MIQCLQEKAENLLGIEDLNANYLEGTEVYIKVEKLVEIINFAYFIGRKSSKEDSAEEV